MTAFLFPGQGAQRPNMLRQLPSEEIITETFSEMSEAIGQDILTLDSGAAQESTIATQLGLLAAGVAMARYLQSQDAEPSVVLGMSVGAFAAAVTANVLSLADAAVLVKERAKWMQSLFPTGYGMAAIVGLNEAQVRRIVDRVSSIAAPVFVTNINADRQIVAAGARVALTQLIEQALCQGAQRADLLNVSVPSHCDLLKPVASKLTDLLTQISIRPPKCVYISNVNARPLRSAQGVAIDLAQNIAHGVRWNDATQVAVELGCKLFLEMPPGHALTDLLHQSHPSVDAFAATPINLQRCLRLARMPSSEGV